MHVAVTDRLTCPKCGPRFGLILLADRVEARRVLEGRFGCPNCREGYPVSDGVADLRPPAAVAAAGTRGADPDAGERPPAAAPADTAARPSDADTGRRLPVAEADPREAGVRLAALLAASGGGGVLALLGADPAEAWALAAVAEDFQVVLVHPDPAALSGRPDPGGGPGAVPRPGAATAPSRILATTAVPFQDGSLRGVAVWPAAAALLPEAVRALAPGARLVLPDVDGLPGVRERLGGLGITTGVDERGVLVGARRR